MLCIVRVWVYRFNPMEYTETLTKLVSDIVCVLFVSLPASFFAIKFPYA